MNAIYPYKLNTNQSKLFENGKNIIKHGNLILNTYEKHTVHCFRIWVISTWTPVVLCHLSSGGIVHIITARKRSLGQGNIFTPVCHSVHRGCVWLLWGGHVWLLWGACVVLFGGGMHGFIRGHVWFYSGSCVVLCRGVWFYSGGVHGFIQGGMRGLSVFSDTMRYGQ